MSNLCLFTEQPCETAAVKADKQGHCVCLHCQAWLIKNVDGFAGLALKRDNDAYSQHLDSVYEIMGVSEFSSKAISSYIAEWKTALEHYAKGPDGEMARKALEGTK